MYPVSLSLISPRPRISVIETTKPEKVLKHGDALKQSMAELRREQALDDVLLFVIDILQVDPHLPRCAHSSAIPRVPFVCPGQPAPSNPTLVQF